MIGGLAESVALEAFSCIYFYVSTALDRSWLSLKYIKVLRPPTKCDHKPRTFSGDNVTGLFKNAWARSTVISVHWAWDSKAREAKTSNIENHMEIGWHTNFYKPTGRDGFGVALKKCHIWRMKEIKKRFRGAHPIQRCDFHTEEQKSAVSFHHFVQRALNEKKKRTNATRLSWIGLAAADHSEPRQTSPSGKIEFGSFLLEAAR